MSLVHAEACEEGHWQPSDDVADLARQNLTGIIASQCAEDCFNHQKNSRLVKGKKKYRRPEKTMGAPLARRVLSSVHHYSEVPCDVPTAGKAVRLKKTAFSSDVREASMDLSKVCSTTQKAPFYSPSASNWTVRDANLDLLVWCHRNNAFTSIGNAFLGAMCKGSHHLLVKHTVLTSGQWMFAVHHWSDSCCLGLPAARGRLPGSDLHYWEPDPSAASFKTFCLLDTRGWRAVHYRWRSPAWQWKASQSAISLPPAVRAFLAEDNEGEDELERVLAKRAFFGLDHAWLCMFADYKRYSLASKSSLFELLFEVVSKTLQVNAETTMIHLRCRLGAFAEDQSFCEELADLDEAAELLEKNDQSRLTEEKKAQENQSMAGRMQQENIGLLTATLNEQQQEAASNREQQT